MRLSCVSVASLRPQLRTDLSDTLHRDRATGSTRVRKGESAMAAGYNCAALERPRASPIPSPFNILESCRQQWRSCLRTLLRLATDAALYVLGAGLLVWMVYLLFWWNFKP